MTIKPFAIQGADLTLGGVNLQAGTTGVVIPGVTQAANYTVEEVNETDADQTYQFAAESEVVVIDKALYDTILGQGNESGFADFTATTDDDGEIDEIQVNGQGTYTAELADRASNNDMYAYIGNTAGTTYTDADLTDPTGLTAQYSAGIYALATDNTKWVDANKADTLTSQTVGTIFTIVLASSPEPYYFTTNGSFPGGFSGTYLGTPPSTTMETPTSITFGSKSASNRPLVPEDWITIPFRPKMRAGEVENIGGGADLGNFSISGNELTAGEIYIYADDGNLELEADSDVNIVANDDVRITGDDTFELRNRSTTDPIRIITNYDQETSEHAWSFDSNGTLTLPGAVVNSTVGKTGADPVYVGSGEAATVIVSPNNNTNLTPGSYNGIYLGIDGGFNINVTVELNGDISAVVTSSNAGISLNSFGTLLGTFIGGATPADDVTITVASLTNIVVPTAIDLTKTINKLTDGAYSLADGTEGQIMYLVRSPETISENVLVDVLNGDGANPLYPFRTNLGFANVDNTGICTLIFTDGNWKQTGGNWD